MPPVLPSATTLSTTRNTWLKLSTACGATLILCWILWAYVAHQRLEAELDSISAAHEPVYSGDLNVPATPDAENAAHYYKLAFPLISGTAVCPSASNLSYAGYPPYPTIWHQMADQAVAADGPALALARQARAFDRTDWGNAGFQLNYLSPARNLANLLADGALAAHFHNDDAEAYERIFDLLHLADCVQKRGLLIGRLVDIGIEALAFDRIDVMAIDLHLKGQARASVGVNRADVMNLIRRLLDDSQEIQRTHETLLAERVATLDSARNLYARSTVLRPMAELATVHYLNDYTVVLRAAENPNFYDAQAMISSIALVQSNSTGADPNPVRFSRFPGIFMGATPRYLEIEYKISYERRVAAVALAANLYRLDHGHWPPNLQALVAVYLAGVPEDPFCPNHRPMGYLLLTLPGGVERPLLFSETSGFATSDTAPATPCFGWQPVRPRSTRQWRDISDWWLRPAPSPAQTVEHQPDQPREHRK